MGLFKRKVTTEEIRFDPETSEHITHGKSRALEER